MASIIPYDPEPDSFVDLKLRVRGVRRREERERQKWQREKGKWRFK